MVNVIACLMAAMSFLLNRAILRHIGPQAAISYSPVIEEAAKTLPAFYLGADVLLTHLGFGLIEAGYDWRSNGKTGGKAAVMSVVGHGLFGLATVGMLKFAAGVWPALSVGIALHLAWNVTVIRLSVRKGKS